jgi:hypothetical protein
MNPRQYDDSIDIMASILGSQQTRSYAPQPQRSYTPRPVSNAQPLTYAPIEQQAQHSTKKRSLRPLFIILFIAIFFSTISTLGYTQRHTILAFLSPPSPFTAEHKSKVNFPLYYPTKLPKGFLIELDSISQPQENVLAYNISDETGNAIQVVEQAFSQTVDLDALLASYQPLEKFELSNGNAVAGTNKDGEIVTHFTNGKTWITLTAYSSSTSLEDIKLLLNSLKAS